MLMMNINFAEYSVVIGKGLPQESIKFVKTTTLEIPPVIQKPAKKVCKYDYPSNFWEGGRNSSYPTGTVVSDRVYIYTGSNYNLMEITVGNTKYTRTKYTRGDSKLITAELVRYEICSISI